MKRACVNLTTSRVTSKLMGIRLLYRMMNVSRLYAKFVEMSPVQSHTVRHVLVACRRASIIVSVLTSAGQVPAGVLGVLSVPDGSANGADQSHDQQDAEQDQDLHVGHPLHV